MGRAARAFSVCLSTQPLKTATLTQVLPDTRLSPADHHPPRLLELDSLRGLAALVVFSSHSILLLPRHPHWLTVALGTPLALFLLGGHQAVILFFLLSGFVLFLPHARPAPAPAPYLPFAAKRVCRIYFPYLAAVAVVAVAYCLTFLPLGPPRDISVYYSWRALSSRAILALLVHHILFLGSFHREYWNSATWSLAEELRISLIFPFLAVLLRRQGWRVSLLCALLASALASAGMHAFHHRFPLATVHYAAIFLLGAILSAHHLRLIVLWQRAGRPFQIAVILLSLLAASQPYRLTPFLPLFCPDEAADWIIALPCSVFLIASISHTWFSRLLRHPYMEHLGRISYSFYLLHLPVLLTLATLFWTQLPHVLLFAIALLLTLLSADLFYRHIERPSIVLGKYLDHRLRLSLAPDP